MTDKQIDHAIAGAYLGKKVVEFRAGYHCAEDEIFDTRVPMFSRSLDLMHEVEVSIRGSENWSAYGLWVFDTTAQEPRPSFHASARQRAEAFLRTVGRWEE